jgi:membrane protease YdiL (CAAX protease family)
MDPSAAPPWQGTRAAYGLALLLGIVPMYGLAILSGVQGQGQPFVVPTTLQLLGSTFLEILIFGGGMALLLYVLCGERMRDLQLQPGSLNGDFARGFVLCFLILLAVIALGPLAVSAGAKDLPEANRALGEALSRDPLMLAVFLGPVLWLKAGGLEEFSRVFMLTRLWHLFPHPGQRLPVVIGSALLFGAGHLWEGWQGVLTTTLIGLILGWYYLRHGRVLPLIVAHGLYDTLATFVMLAIVSGKLPAG